MVIVAIIGIILGALAALLILLALFDRSANWFEGERYRRRRARAALRPARIAPAPAPASPLLPRQEREPVPLEGRRNERTEGVVGDVV